MKTYLDKLMENNKFKKKFEEEYKSMTNKKIILEQDFIIPKGTIFKLMDGDATFYKGTNYEASISVSKDNCGRFIVGTEIEDSGFEPIPEAPYDAYFSYVEYKHMWESLKSAKCKGDKALEASLKALMDGIEEETL